MLKIQRTANGDVVFTLIGRLERDNARELLELIAVEPAGRSIVLDLKELVLVDRESVHFLQQCEGQGIKLRDCPTYVRVWISHEGAKR
jgi:anti-anti-sigma regulatory factor